MKRVYQAPPHPRAGWRPVLGGTLFAAALLLGMEFLLKLSPAQDASRAKPSDAHELVREPVVAPPAAAAGDPQRAMHAATPSLLVELPPPAAAAERREQGAPAAPAPAVRAVALVDAIPGGMPEGWTKLDFADAPAVPREPGAVAPSGVAAGVPGGVPGGLPGGVVGAASLDAPPAVVSRVTPEYPARLRRAGVEADVVLQLDVDVRGAVADVSVISSTDARFDEHAIAAVRRWRFAPGQVGGRPVAFRMRLPIRFELKD